MSETRARSSTSPSSAKLSVQCAIRLRRLRSPQREPTFATAPRNASSRRTRREEIPRAAGDEVDPPPLATDFGEMTDLGRPARQAGEVARWCDAPQRSCSGESDRWHPSGCSAWDPKNAIGDGAFIPDRPRHAVCLFAGGLRLNCQFCSTATQGFNRNHHRRDHRPGVVAAPLPTATPHQQRKSPTW